ncbi:DUF6114 domain-containing protein [Nonomuraea rubra]|uniref:DUF6114 domain-containing protein n=1 Tax=Nonomuraea rubra TaxID=46180 RepID=UPI0033D8EAB2
MLLRKVRQGARRQTVRSWRRSRPFWSGLFIVAAGAELLCIPLALDALPVAIRFGAVGVSYLIALIMIMAGVLVWLQPAQRVFLGLVVVVLSMASFVYSNLGGFLVGMILGLLGGMLAVAWTPDSRPDNRFDTVSVRGAFVVVRKLGERGRAAIAARRRAAIDTSPVDARQGHVSPGRREHVP